MKSPNGKSLMRQTFEVGPGQLPVALPGTRTSPGYWGGPYSHAYSNLEDDGRLIEVSYEILAPGKTLAPVGSRK